MTIPNDDTLAILKSSLDSSFTYANRSIRSKETVADTNFVSAQLGLDTLMNSFLKRKGGVVLKYIHPETLCNEAHYLIKTGVRGPYVTNVLSFKKDSSGGYLVALERFRKVPWIKKKAKDSIYGCEDGSSQWTIFLRFSKTNNGLRPTVEHWEVH